MNNNFDPKNHIGETHGVYTIIDMLDEKDKYGHWIYVCRCNVCGYIKHSHYGSISGEKSKTINCNHVRANGDIITCKYKWKERRLGKIFSKMISRCYNIHNKDYIWYGAKGIKIWKPWLDNPQLFEEWAINNGYNNNLTIDRIKSDKDYCPDNCQWIALRENSRKAGSVNWITIDNQTLTGRQWAEMLHVGTNAINRAIKEHGLDKTKELIEAMLLDPPSTKHRKSHQTWFDVYGIPT